MPALPPMKPKVLDNNNPTSATHHHTMAQAST